MKNRHVLIVGGSKGLGRAVARAMAKAGYGVSVISRKEPPQKYKGVCYWTVDITEQDCLPGVLKEIVRKNGKLNHIVFCQQFRGDGDDWIGQIGTSLSATKHIIESSLDGFKNGSNERSIVIIGSVASRWIAKEQPVSYHVAKAGLEQMIRYYALTLGPRGIRVNGISPNTILKDENREFYLHNKKLYGLYKKISPLGRMVTSEDIVQALAFLCGPQASSITGQNIIIDAGVTLQEHASLARTLMSLDNVKITQRASGAKV